MSGEVIHPDQTTKQPVVWVCTNPFCQTSPLAGVYFEFTGDYPRCPKCSADGAPTVQKRILVHLLVADREGRILGQAGRYSLACDKTREVTATHGNGEAVTDQPRVVNCPGCLQEIGKRIIKPAGRPVDIAN